MKKVLLFLLLCSGLLLSCSKSESHATANTSLAGTWKLVETLADPGDGSGTWQPASASLPLIITFTPDGRIEGNAFPQAHRYAVANDTNIQFTFADGTYINYNYILANATLMLSGGGCIEACGLKFQKTQTLR